MPKSIKVLAFRSFYHTTQAEAVRMLQNGEAEKVNGNPRLIRILETPIFDEELEYLTGRRVSGITKGGSGARKPLRRLICNKCGYSQTHCKCNKPDIVSTVVLRGRFSVGRSHWCRPPRVQLPEDERDFRRYKQAYLTRHGREGEEAARAARRD